MATFVYSGRARDGSKADGTRAAADEMALANDLAKEGIFLIEASLATTLAVGRSGKVKVKRKDLIAFLLHVGSYLEAGVPVMDALEDYRVPERPALDAAYQDLRGRLEGGSSLSEGMEAHPTIFKTLLVNMVRAGETSGKLDESLREVVRLLEWEEEFAGQVKQASMYPAIVLSIMVLAFTAVTIFALPAIIKLLKELNVPLPFATRLFLAIGEGLASWGWLVALLGVIVFAGCRLALRSPEVRLWWDTLVLRLPLVGPMVTKLGLSRFSTFFSSQYRAGIPVIQVLRECQAITGNARLALCVHRIREGVEAGERLAVMAAAVGYFPRLVVRMLAIGEEAGNLEQTLGKVSLYFDAEVKTGLKRFFQLLEPVILVVIAVLLIFTAMAILLPIYMSIGGISTQAH